MTDYAVTLVSPHGYEHAQALRDVAVVLDGALRALGHDSFITESGRIPGRRHIVLGAQILQKYPLRLAPDAVLYNFEPLDCQSDWWKSGEYAALLRQHAVWDYDAQNAERLRAAGIEVQAVVPMGYAAELQSVQRYKAPDLDVLFFGSINERRLAVLREMERLGLKVLWRFGCYGRARDELVARARLVLNVHFYEVMIQEAVRLMYLFANRAAVLSEVPAAQLAGGAVFTEYADLPQRAAQLVENDEERERIAEDGFQLARAMPMSDHLRRALQ